MPTAAIKYDTFEGPSLNPELWQTLSIPDPHGSMTALEDPSAKVTVGAGTAAISIPQFSRCHDTSPALDNAKQFIVATTPIRTSMQGSVTFSAQMAAEKFRGTNDDYRDGFASFNLFDLASGMVFDLINTGTRILAIYERLAIDGVPAEESFLHVIDTPLSGLTTSPGKFHHYAITLDGNTRSVQFSVDSARVLVLPAVAAWPQHLSFGMGLMSLCPFADGAGSTSLRGQGMAGQWRNFAYECD